MLARRVRPLLRAPLAPAPVLKTEALAASLTLDHVVYPEPKTLPKPPLPLVLPLVAADVVAYPEPNTLPKTVELLALTSATALALPTTVGKLLSAVELASVLATLPPVLLPPAGPPKNEVRKTGDFLFFASPKKQLFAASSAVNLSFAMAFQGSSLFSTMVMNGLCAGLGEENGFAFGDLGEGRTKGGGIEKEDDFAAELAEKLDSGAVVVLDVVPNEKGLLAALFAIALANGFVLA